ncbi:hypothetical protein B0T20DRAFT_390215 [Sordaria brevicollis]|uniref:Uncharacterized protein n=1 Tax=Sordaria brevicollis TaxID=83679 RepID=A0AAE0PLV3_SORBR|nr:hypothetical protein B0T20DRAFT_390215 [Sordaria brevicollis]
MASSGTRAITEYVPPLSGHTALHDEEKVPLQDSLPSSTENFQSSRDLPEQVSLGQQPYAGEDRFVSAPDGKYIWSSGVFRRFPHLGVLPLLLNMVCTGAAIATVLYSDGGLVSEWSGVMQPPVLLAYTSTAANMLLGIAFACGCSICFWTQALGGEMPVTSLHHHWEGASSFLGALSALTRRKAVRLSLVSVLVTVSSLLRGPLMQRASSVQTRELSLPGTVDVEVYPGIRLDDSVFSRVPGPQADGRLTFPMILRGYRFKDPIVIPGAENCKNCSLTVKALGFERSNCSVTESTLPEAEQWMSYGELSESFLQTRIFQIHIRSEILEDMNSATPKRYLSDYSTLNITVTRKVSHGWEAKLLTQSCLIIPSIVSYALIVDRGNTTLASTSWRDDAVLTNVHATLAWTGLMEDKEWELISMESNFQIMLLDMQRLGAELWESQTNVTVHLWHNGRRESDAPPRVDLDYSGLAGYLYAQEYPGRLDRYVNCCGPTFDDPMDDIINSYREIAFRMSILEAAANKRNITNANTTESDSHPWSITSQSVDYVSDQVRVEYKANFPALALALAISLLGPLATLTLFWGYWRLGREFSMSPIELANAFIVRGLMLPVSETGATSYAKSQGSEDHYRQISLHGQDQHQSHDQKQLATLLASCSSNASAKEIAKHCAGKPHHDRWWNTFFRSRRREPRVQYGVLESTGQLGFAVADEQGVIHARKPREGEML